LLSPLPFGTTSPPGWPSQLAWSPSLSAMLNPDSPVVCVVHPDVLSGQSSDFEAQLVAGLIWLLNGRLSERLANERDPVTGATLAQSPTPYTSKGLLSKGVGVVTPHRAQISKIVSQLGGVLPGVPVRELRAAVDSVERYQGQQRDVIIGSYAVGDPDTISDEDEFLQSFNRFNVMASRARAKVVVVISESLVQHLPGDIDVLRDSALLKSFAETFCSNRSNVDVHWHDPNALGSVSTVSASLRVP
jgi:DNA replication ATP-dependent helicase Dna2